MPFDPTTRPLTAAEARVLATLMEKARTVPDSYPLSLNSLTLGCNQKTARDPVLNATEAEVQDAVDALKGLHLVFEASGSALEASFHGLSKASYLLLRALPCLLSLHTRPPSAASATEALSRAKFFAPLPPSTQLLRSILESCQIFSLES